MRKTLPNWRASLSNCSYPCNIHSIYVLLIQRLVLESGRRLFPKGGAFTTLRLITTKATDNGVVIATYQLAEPLAGEITETIMY
jgi:hypothetical protein